MRKQHHRGSSYGFFSINSSAEINDTRTILDSVPRITSRGVLQNTVSYIGNRDISKRLLYGGCQNFR